MAEPSGEPQSQPKAESESELAAILARPDVQAAILTAAAKAADETEREYQVQLTAVREELGKKESGWGKERSQLRAERDARAKSEDSDTLQAAMAEAEAKAQTAAETLQAATARERRAEVREIIADLKEAHQGLPREFWTSATERLLKGEVRSHIIGLEALNYKTKAQEPSQPTGIRSTQPTASAALAAYVQSLKEGKPLPSAQEIDQMTSRYK